MRAFDPCPSERFTSNFAIPSRRGTPNIYILPYPATKSLQSRPLVEIAMAVGVHSSTRESLTKVFGAAWGRAGGEWRARQKRTRKKYHSFRIITGEHPGDHNHQDFPKSIAIQMGGVLRYKWEAYCDTNGRSTEEFLFPGNSVAPKALQYKLGTYCNTFLRSSGGWGF